MRRSVETSLRRLDTDYLDLLWVHAWDPCTPPEEMLRGLDDLVRTGKVLSIGVSNTPAWVVSRSAMMAELRGWTTFSAMQVEYSVIARTPEREVLPMANELGIPVSAWSPLARGRLAGKGGDDANSSLSARARQAIAVVNEVAEEIGTTPARVALAWVMSQGVMPSIGARTAAQLHDNLGALEVRLDSSQLDRIDAASRVRLGYPHEFLRDRAPELARYRQSAM